MMLCDIVIPAYNSAAVLPATIAALFGQSLPAGISPRLVVSSDGSTDQTVAVAKSLIPPTAWRSTIVAVGPHAGPAAARNRGIACATAPLLVFLGADIILRPQALAAHIDFHATHPAVHAAALGMIRWDPRLNPSPLMEWMAHGGGQNDFDSLLGQTTADPRHFFYGSHLSIKRAALKGASFPAAYQTYGWEDLDLGRFLASRLTLHVLLRAVGLHRHYYTPDDVWRRQYLVGRGIVTYQQRYPAVPLLPHRPQLHAVKIKLATVTGVGAILYRALLRTADSFSTPRLFSLATTLAFWQGVYELESFPHKITSYPQ